MSMCVARARVWRRRGFPTTALDRRRWWPYGERRVRASSKPRGPYSLWLTQTLNTPSDVFSARQGTNPTDSRNIKNESPTSAWRRSSARSGLLSTPKPADIGAGRLALPALWVPWGASSSPNRAAKSARRRCRASLDHPLHSMSSRGTFPGAQSHSVGGR